jgi:toxin-antitoxin system PIN domain toxin
MDLPDVNILLLAHRKDLDGHIAVNAWLQARLAGPAPIGFAELALSSFLRIVTNPRVFRVPTPMDTALEFVDTLLCSSTSVRIRPGPRHFGIFTDLCRAPGLRAGLVADAYFAALAIESGCRFVTRDRDFARFRDLDWYDPLDSGRG